MGKGRTRADGGRPAGRQHRRTAEWGVPDARGQAGRALGTRQQGPGGGLGARQQGPGRAARVCATYPHPGQRGWWRRAASRVRALGVGNSLSLPSRSRGTVCGVRVRWRGGGRGLSVAASAPPPCQGIAREPPLRARRACREKQGCPLQCLTRRRPSAQTQRAGSGSALPSCDNRGAFTAPASPGWVAGWGGGSASRGGPSGALRAAMPLTVGD